MNSKFFERLGFIILGFAIMFSSISCETTSASVAAQVVAQFPDLNSSIATFFSNANSGDCYKLAGYVNLLSQKEQTYLAGQANYSNGRCFQRPTSDTGKASEKSAYERITADMTTSTTSDVTIYKKSIAVYKSVELKYGSSSDSTNVNKATNSFFSTYVQANKCVSLNLKALREIIIFSRNILFSTLDNLNAVCKLQAISSDATLTVFVGCKMSLTTATKLLAIYQKLAPCLMTFHGQFAMTTYSARATISQLAQCKVSGNSNQTTTSRLLEEAAVSASVSTNISGGTANTNGSASISASGSVKATKRSVDCSLTETAGGTARVLETAAASANASVPSVMGSMASNIESALNSAMSAIKSALANTNVSVNASANASSNGFLNTLDNFWKKTVNIVTKNFEKAKKAVSSMTKDYKVCKVSQVTFNSKGKFVLPIDQASLNLITSSEANFKATFTSSDAVDFGTFMDSVLNADSGYNPSCAPLAQTIHTNFNLGNNSVFAKINGRVKSNKAGSNYWYLCQYNSTTSTLDCGCKVGDCSQINSNTSISYSLSSNAWVNNFSSIHIAVWRIDNTTTYFSEYSTSSTASDGTTYGDQKFEYQVGSSKSNPGVCHQTVGCMQMSVNSYKTTSSKEGCSGKMQSQCESALDTNNSKSDGSNVLASSIAIDDMPFMDATTPDAEFIEFISEFLISEDGFQYQGNVYSDFASAVASYNMNYSSMRNLETSPYDSRLESDSGAQVDQGSYDNSEVNTDGSTSTQAASPSAIQTNTTAYATDYNNGNYHNASSIICYSINLILLLGLLLL